MYRLTRSTVKARNNRQKRSRQRLLQHLFFSALIPKEQKGEVPPHRLRPPKIPSPREGGGSGAEQSPSPTQKTLCTHPHLMRGVQQHRVWRKCLTLLSMISTPR